MLLINAADADFKRAILYFCNTEFIGVRTESHRVDLFRQKSISITAKWIWKRAFRIRYAV